MSSTVSPQRCTHFTTFCAALTAPVTRCTLPSSRTPDMPIGSRMPSCESMMNSCGSTWITRWSAGIATARAASITRSTSPALTSLSRIATMPCEFSERTWLPAMPVSTVLISQPAMSSASSTARWIDCTVDSMFTTTPRLSPRDGFEPSPITSILLSSDSSPTIATTLEVPMSRPTTNLRSSRLLMFFPPDQASPLATVRCRRGRRERGIRRRAPADREPVRVAQVHVAHARQLGCERGRDDVEEAQEALVDVAPAEPDLEPAAEHEAPRAALVEAQPLELQVRLGEAPAHREIAPCDVLLRAGRAREARQLRERVLRVLGEELAAHVQQAVVAPARGRLMLADPHDHPVGPRAADAHPIDPVDVLHPRAQVLEVERQVVADRGLDLQRRHALERAFHDELAGRLIEQRLRAAKRAERREGDERQREREPDSLAPDRRESRRLEPRRARLRSAAVLAAADHRVDLASPTTRTSSSSRTPDCLSTSARTRSISSSISAAVASPELTMKFACFSDTTAPPTRAPLSPALSMSRPAKSPGGLRNTEPQLGTRSGWVALRRASIALRPPAVVASRANAKVAPRNHSPATPRTLR